MKSFWKNRKEKVKYLKWLGRYSKPFVGRILLVILFRVLVSVLGLSMAILSKRIIDHATLGKAHSVLFFMGIYGGAILLTEIFGMIQNLLRTMLSERFSFGIRKELYERILRSDWTKAQGYHSGDIMTRLTSDAGTIADGIVGSAAELLSLVIELFLVFFTLFYYSKLLAVFALVIAPVAVLTSWWLGKKLQKLQIKVQQSESAYRSFLQESIANLLIMKAFSNEDYASDRLAKLREDRFYWVFRKAKYGMISSSVVSLSFHVGYIVAFTYGALQIAAQVITYGTMSVFLTWVNRVQAPIMQIAYQIPRIVSVLASTERIMELQGLEMEDYGELPKLSGGIGLEIDDLSFGYAEDKILEKVSLKVEPGEMVAIMGESGIGKTTLIRLVMSFLSPDEGKITFFDTQGKEAPCKALIRKYIAYVPQGNTLFSGTIRENIRMGKLDATQEEMLEVLERTASLSFVQNLPNGLDTVIGEKGYGLSEGQAQRLAIARALIKKAPVLILDEATSALDEETELTVLKGLQGQMPKPTCLVITHRRSVLQYCDREIKIHDRMVD